MTDYRCSSHFPGTKDRCAKYFGDHSEHHSLDSGRRWTTDDVLEFVNRRVRLKESARMSTEKLASYAGRHWALNVDQHGVTASVHHFGDPQVRDWWVLMDPELRIPVEESHKDVKAWIKDDPSKVELSWWSKLWTKISNAWN